MDDQGKNNNYSELLEDNQKGEIIKYGKKDKSKHNSFNFFPLLIIVILIIGIIIICLYIMTNGFANNINKKLPIKEANEKEQKRLKTENEEEINLLSEENKKLKEELENIKIKSKEKELKLLNIIQKLKNKDKLKSLVDLNENEIFDKLIDILEIFDKNEKDLELCIESLKKHDYLNYKKYFDEKEEEEEEEEEEEKQKLFDYINLSNQTKETESNEDKLIELVNINQEYYVEIKSLTIEIKQLKSDKLALEKQNKELLDILIKVEQFLQCLKNEVNAQHYYSEGKFTREEYNYFLSNDECFQAFKSIVLSPD